MKRTYQSKAGRKEPKAEKIDSAAMKKALNASLARRGESTAWKGQRVLDYRRREEKRAKISRSQPTQPSAETAGAPDSV